MTTTLTRPRTGLRRAVSGVAAGALASLALVSVPTTAHAADEVAAPTLAWKISDRFFGHLTTRTITDGATEDASGVVTFVDGVGTHDSGNGATTVSYQGSVTGAFAMGGTTYYSVTIADPQIVVDSDGEGTLSAEVSSYVGTPTPTSSEPTRVTVTTFDAVADDWNLGDGLASLTATPDWTGVLPADSEEATALGIPSGQPVDGASFAPEFLGAILSGVRAHFYASGASSDTAKAPASFTATAPRPSVSLTKVSDTEWVAAGTGFTQSTNPGPAEAGVYVGVAEAGGLPDVSSQQGIAAFAAASYVPTISGDAGTFSTTLTIDATKIDPTKTYAVYTWRAHTHSTTSQDTETALPLDLDAFKASTTTSVAVTTKSAFGNTATATATVTGSSTGTVQFFDGSKSLGTAALSAGKATKSLPANLAVGRHTITAKFLGSGSALASTSAAKTLTVVKASTTTAVKVTKKPTSKKKGRAVIAVKTKAKSQVPTGKVTVTLKKGTSVKKVKAKVLRNGKVSIILPKLKKGTWKATVSYAGASTHTASKRVVKIKITK